MLFDLDVCENFSFKLFQCVRVEICFYFLYGYYGLFIFANVHFPSTPTSYYLLEQNLVGINNYLFVFPQHFNQLMQSQSPGDVVVQHINDWVEFRLLEVFTDNLLSFLQPLIAVNVVL